MRSFMMFAIGTGLGACAPTVLAVNELADPSFELSAPLQIAASVPTNLTQVQGHWGTQNGVKVGGIFGGTTDGIVPFDPQVMARLVRTGEVSGVTLAYQAISLGAYASLIDSGRATVQGSEMFNAPFAGAVGLVTIEYIDSSGLYTPDHKTGPMSIGTLGLDSDLIRWDAITVDAPVPVSTRWILFSVGFQNESLGTGAGYVDFNNVSIGPTPGTAGLLGMAALAGLRRKR